LIFFEGAFVKELTGEEIDCRAKGIAGIIRKMRAGKPVKFKLEEFKEMIKFSVDNLEKVNYHLLSDLRDRYFLRDLIKGTEYAQKRFPREKKEKPHRRLNRRKWIH